MISCNPLVALNRHRTPLILHCKILAHSPGPISQEGVGKVKWLRGEKGVKEIVKSLLEDPRWANIRWQWLIIPCCRPMKGFDRAGWIYPCRTRVLFISRQHRRQHIAPHQQRTSTYALPKVDRFLILSLLSFPLGTHFNTCPQKVGCLVQPHGLGRIWNESLLYI